MSDNFSDPTNEDRVVRAETALKVHSALIDGEPDIEECNITDILADLMHFAYARGFDFDACLETAGMHFNIETTEVGS